MHAKLRVYLLKTAHLLDDEGADGVVVLGPCCFGIGQGQNSKMSSNVDGYFRCSLAQVHDARIGTKLKSLKILSFLGFEVTGEEKEQTFLSCWFKRFNEGTSPPQKY